MLVLYFCHICQKPIVHGETSDALGSGRTANHYEFDAYLHMRDEHGEFMTDGMPLSCERFEGENAVAVGNMFRDYQSRRGGEAVG